ncbi:hypothetical protein L1987_37984 [Smallanthus sonchifolius]|uniref:Uncharacterized protein n=1 Tax=Smallanthus sonchifolius TaxID=185202 RepID=A0ACB9HI94_9ASTR|nr:hypothetical protein L1987_37984 [Smallanthus sonchifolius]
MGKKVLIQVLCAGDGGIVALDWLALRLMLEPATQMVTEDELLNHEHYEDILEDMRLECERFGFDIGPLASASWLNGLELTSLAYYAKEESVEWYDGSCSSTLYGQAIPQFFTSNELASFHSQRLVKSLSTASPSICSC